ECSFQNRLNCRRTSHPRSSLRSHTRRGRLVMSKALFLGGAALALSAGVASAQAPGTMAVKVTVLAVAVLVIANYLASVIDGQRIGIGSPGIIECCVSAVAVEKAVIDPITVLVSSDNLSSFVNA